MAGKLVPLRTRTDSIDRNGDGRVRVLHMINQLIESGGAERFVVGLATQLA